MAGDAEIDEQARGPSGGSRRGPFCSPSPPAVVAAKAPGSSDSVKSLRVLDYYTNEPDKSIYTKVLNACGEANGVTIQREAVPGDTLIQKVLQQSSSKTLAGRRPR